MPANERQTCRARHHDLLPRPTARPPAAQTSSVRPVKYAFSLPAMSTMPFARKIDGVGFASHGMQSPSAAAAAAAAAADASSSSVCQCSAKRPGSQNSSASSASNFEPSSGLPDSISSVIAPNVGLDEGGAPRPIEKARRRRDFERRQRQTVWRRRRERVAAGFQTREG